MADEGQDRTEEATPRRREEAREQGQVAHSQDFAGSILLLAGLVALVFMGRSIGGGLLDVFRNDLSRLLYDDMDTVRTRMLFLRLFIQGMLMLGGFFGMLVAIAILAGILQVGFHITPERLEVDFEKLSPARGWERLFSLASVVRGLLAALKLIGLAVIAYVVIRGRIGMIFSIGTGSLQHGVDSAWALTMRLALFMAGMLALLGLIDFIYQKQRFETSLRMTKQEVKEELKREEGDPMIKARIRQIARERARRRMLAAVPKATVVITNPLHLAVALKYEVGKGKNAPMVVAKGAGVLARRIVEIAREHGVPIIERPPVAQALYKFVAEDKEIPANFFKVVAEVLALVYRLRGTV